MCGIAGIFNFRGECPESDILARMIESVRNRGPDGLGFHKDRHVSLAHARLSIIDLQGGHQPMSNEDGSVWVTFNGEIFNYIELRDELEALGHRFKTRADTEVILHLYEQEREECVQRLNGQWAFAVWDSQRRRMFLSRDRLGIRPLFYAFTRGSFLFASAMKSLLSHPEVSRAIDLEALDQIFTFWTALPPHTIFSAIRTLPPGHSMTVQDGQAKTWAYWTLRPAAEAVRDEVECAERLLDLLSEATRIQLRSDVPVGAYLSGGLDSTVTTAVVRRLKADSLKTFSVRFEDPEFDEGPYQRLAVRHLETEHREVLCSREDIGRVFPEVIWHAEAPILRTAPAPLFILSRLVHDEGFKVVVTGEGADEFLGGYDIYKELKVRKFWAAQPNSTFRPLLLKRLYPYLKSMQGQSTEYLKAFFHVLPGDLESPFFSHLPRWEMTTMAKVFFSEEVRSATQGLDPLAALEKMLPEGFSGWDDFLKAQYLEGTLLLPGYILSSQGDRVAMAHAVEGRFPFLDHRMVEFGFSQPARLKMKALSEKHILKVAASKLVPREVTQRHKQPFRAPDAVSFFDASAGRARQDYVEQLLGESSIREHGIFDPEAVKVLVKKAKAGKVLGAKDNMALVGVLSTQLLMEQLAKNVRKWN